MIEFYKINEPHKYQQKLIGNGLQKCLFALHENEYEKWESKLVEIIKAVGLDTKKDIVICMMESHDLKSLIPVIEQYGITRVITFGEPVSTLFPNIDKQFYDVIETESYSWLSAPPLSELLIDPSEKMKLWKSLKYQFRLLRTK